MSRALPRRSHALPAPRPSPADPGELPGYYIRRLQQIAVAVFLDETAEAGITPVQFAALNTLRRRPGIDQRSLASAIGLDPSTIGGVVERLERRGLLRRAVSSSDRRLRSLELSAAGARLLVAVTPQVLRSQQRLLAPLPAGERERFVAALRTLVESNNALSRAPKLDEP
jgi:DNA-binding MarR family transcriptional regulator